MLTKLFTSSSQQFTKACRTGDTHTVARLVKAHPSLVHSNITLSTCGVNQTTGLCIAAEHGHRYVVDLLLTHRANPNFSGTGDPADSVYHPLITACHNGHLSCVNALLKAGADPNAVSAFGTPLELIALRYEIEPPEAFLLLLLHSKEPLRLRTAEDMKRQHRPEDIRYIRRKMTVFHRTTQHIGTQARKMFGKRNVSTRKVSLARRGSARRGSGSGRRK